MTVENLKGNTDLSIKSGSLKQFSPIASATTLLNEAVYYIDASTPRPNYPGYIALDNANVYAFAPDVSDLDITGDIDLRVKISLDDWTPGAAQEFIAKYGAAGQRSYLFRMNSGNVFEFTWSADGTATNTKTSTVSPTVSDGNILWVRVTLDVDNGSTQNEVKFYTSTDGTTWTQLGTTVTSAGVTSIFNSTASTVMGGGASSYTAGKIYRAQVLNGINGTTVLDANFETNVTSSTFDTFTPTVGPLVSIRGENLPVNIGTAGSLLPTTQGSARSVDSNDPKFLDHTGTNYVYLPGILNNSLSVPDNASLDITGDIDLRAYVALDDWTPTAINSIIAKEATANRSYHLRVLTTGLLQLLWYVDGTNVISQSSTTALTVADGAALWIRATLDVDNGASGYDVKFYTSPDGTTWTQLGTTVTGASTTSIFSGIADVTLGHSSTSGNYLAGKLYRAQIFDGIDGTKVLDVDTSVITAGSATSFTAVTGQTVTINRSTSGRKTVAVTQPTWLFGTDDYMEVNNRYMSSGTYLYLPGVSGNNATAPDAAALDITGDIDIRVKVALDDWTPVNTVLISKHQTSSTRSWGMQISTTGRPGFWWSADGTTETFVQSTVAPTIADGATKWIRVTFDVDNGASGNDANFYTSDDGTTWTQIGATVTTAGTTSIFNSTSQLMIGGYLATATSSLPARGKFFRAQVLNGINGTVAFDANFETSITSLLQTSFTESSANAATVTINRSGSAYRSAGITAAGYLYPGATNTFAASATDFLNFGASDSFTVLITSRTFNNNVSGPGSGLMGKKLASAASGAGYMIRNYASQIGGTDTYISDGTTQVNAYLPSGNIAGLFLASTLVRNVSTDLLTAYANTATTGTGAQNPVTDTTTGSLADIISTLRIGLAVSLYMDGEIYAVAVWRRRLLAPEIGAIYEYFKARD